MRRNFELIRGSYFIVCVVSVFFMVSCQGKKQTLPAGNATPQSTLASKITSSIGAKLVAEASVPQDKADLLVAKVDERLKSSSNRQVKTQSTVPRLQPKNQAIRQEVPSLAEISLDDPKISAIIMGLVLDELDSPEINIKVDQIGHVTQAALTSCVDVMKEVVKDTSAAEKKSLLSDLVVNTISNLTGAGLVPSQMVSVVDDVMGAVMGQADDMGLADDSLKETAGDLSAAAMQGFANVVKDVGADASVVVAQFAQTAALGMMESLNDAGVKPEDIASFSQQVIQGATEAVLSVVSDLGLKDSAAVSDVGKYLLSGVSLGAQAVFDDFKSQGATVDDASVSAMLTQIDEDAKQQFTDTVVANKDTSTIEIKAEEITQSVQDFNAAEIPPPTLEIPKAPEIPATVSFDIREKTMSVQILSGDQFQFNVDTQGLDSTQEVIWSVSSFGGIDKGTIDTNGLYTAASARLLKADSIKVTIKAALASDPNIFSSFDVVIIKKLRSMTIQPQVATLFAGDSLLFTIQTNNIEFEEVVDFVTSPAGMGRFELSADGKQAVYFAPTEAQLGATTDKLTVKVGAQLKADKRISAFAVVDVVKKPKKSIQFNERDVVIYEMEQANLSLSTQNLESNDALEWSLEPQGSSYLGELVIDSKLTAQYRAAQHELFPADSSSILVRVVVRLQSDPNVFTNLDLTVLRKPERVVSLLPASAVLMSDDHVEFAVEAKNIAAQDVLEWRVEPADGVYRGYIYVNHQYGRRAFYLAPGAASFPAGVSEMTVNVVASLRDNPNVFGFSQIIVHKKPERIHLEPKVVQLVAGQEFDLKAYIENSTLPSEIEWRIESEVPELTGQLKTDPNNPWMINYRAPFASEFAKDKNYLNLKIIAQLKDKDVQSWTYVFVQKDPSKLVQLNLQGDDTVYAGHASYAYTLNKANLPVDESGQEKEILWSVRISPDYPDSSLNPGVIESSDAKSAYYLPPSVDSLGRYDSIVVILKAEVKDNPSLVSEQAIRIKKDALLPELKIVWSLGQNELLAGSKEIPVSVNVSGAQANDKIIWELQNLNPVPNADYPLEAGVLLSNDALGISAVYTPPQPDQMSASELDVVLIAKLMRDRVLAEDKILLHIKRELPQRRVIIYPSQSVNVFAGASINFQAQIENPLATDKLEWSLYATNTSAAGMISFDSDAFYTALYQAPYKSDFPADTNLLNVFVRARIVGTDIGAEVPVLVQKDAQNKTVFEIVGEDSLLAGATAMPYQLKKENLPKNPDGSELEVHWNLYLDPVQKDPNDPDSLAGLLIKTDNAMALYQPASVSELGTHLLVSVVLEARIDGAVSLVSQKRIVVQNSQTITRIEIKPDYIPDLVAGSPAMSLFAQTEGMQKDDVIEWSVKNLNPQTKSDYSQGVGFIAVQDAQGLNALYVPPFDYQMTQDEVDALISTRLLRAGVEVAHADVHVHLRRYPLEKIVTIDANEDIMKAGETRDLFAWVSNQGPSDAIEWFVETDNNLAPGLIQYDVQNFNQARYQAPTLSEFPANVDFINVRIVARLVGTEIRAQLPLVIQKNITSKIQFDLQGDDHTVAGSDALKLKLVKDNLPKKPDGSEYNVQYSLQTKDTSGNFNVNNSLGELINQSPEGIDYLPPSVELMGDRLAFVVLVRAELDGFSGIFSEKLIRVQRPDQIVELQVVPQSLFELTAGSSPVELKAEVKGFQEGDLIKWKINNYAYDPQYPNEYGQVIQQDSVGFSSLYVPPQKEDMSPQRDMLYFNVVAQFIRQNNVLAENYASVKIVREKAPSSIGMNPDYLPMNAGQTRDFFAWIQQGNASDTLEWRVEGIDTQNPGMISFDAQDFGHAVYQAPLAQDFPTQADFINVKVIVQIKGTEIRKEVPLLIQKQAGPKPIFEIMGSDFLLADSSAESYSLNKQNLPLNPNGQESDVEWSVEVAKEYQNPSSPQLGAGVFESTSLKDALYRPAPAKELGDYASIQVVLTAKLKDFPSLWAQKRVWIQKGQQITRIQIQPSYLPMMYAGDPAIDLSLMTEGMTPTDTIEWSLENMTPDTSLDLGVLLREDAAGLMMQYLPPQILPVPQANFLLHARLMRDGFVAAEDQRYVMLFGARPQKVIHFYMDASPLLAGTERSLSAWVENFDYQNDKVVFKVESKDANLTKIGSIEKDPNNMMNAVYTAPQAQDFPEGVNAISVVVTAMLENSDVKESHDVYIVKTQDEIPSLLIQGDGFMVAGDAAKHYLLSGSHLPKNPDGSPANIRWYLEMMSGPKSALGQLSATSNEYADYIPASVSDLGDFYAADVLLVAELEQAPGVRAQFVMHVQKEGSYTSIQINPRTLGAIYGDDVASSLSVVTQGMHVEDRIEWSLEDYMKDPNYPNKAGSLSVQDSNGLNVVYLPPRVDQMPEFPYQIGIVARLMRQDKTSGSNLEIARDFIQIELHQYRPVKKIHIYGDFSPMLAGEKRNYMASVDYRDLSDEVEWSVEAVAPVVDYQGQINVLPNPSDFTAEYQAPSEQDFKDPNVSGIRVKILAHLKGSDLKEEQYIYIAKSQQDLPVFSIQGESQVYAGAQTVTYNLNKAHLPLKPDGSEDDIVWELKSTLGYQVGLGSIVSSDNNTLTYLPPTVEEMNGYVNYGVTISAHLANHEYVKTEFYVYVNRDRPVMMHIAPEQIGTLYAGESAVSLSVTVDGSQAGDVIEWSVQDYNQNPDYPLQAGQIVADAQGLTAVYTPPQVTDMSQDYGSIMIYAKLMRPDAQSSSMMMVAQDVRYVQLRKIRPVKLIHLNSDSGPMLAGESKNYSAWLENQESNDQLVWSVEPVTVGVTSYGQMEFDPASAYNAIYHAPQEADFGDLTGMDVKIVVMLQNDPNVKAEQYIYIAKSQQSMPVLSIQGDSQVYAGGSTLAYVLTQQNIPYQDDIVWELKSTLGYQVGLGSIVSSDNNTLTYLPPTVEEMNGYVNYGVTISAHLANHEYVKTEFYVYVNRQSQMVYLSIDPQQIGTLYAGDSGYALTAIVSGSMAGDIVEWSLDDSVPNPNFPHQAGQLNQAIDGLSALYVPPQLSDMPDNENYVYVTVHARLMRNDGSGNSQVVAQDMRSITVMKHAVVTKSIHIYPTTLDLLVGESLPETASLMAMVENSEPNDSVEWSLESVNAAPMGVVHYDTQSSTMATYESPLAADFPQNQTQIQVKIVARIVGTNIQAELIATLNRVNVQPMTLMIDGVSTLHAGSAASLYSLSVSNPMENMGPIVWSVEVEESYRDPQNPMLGAGSFLETTQTGASYVPALAEELNGRTMIMVRIKAMLQDRPDIYAIKDVIIESQPATQVSFALTVQAQEVFAGDLVNVVANVSGIDVVNMPAITWSVNLENVVDPLPSQLDDAGVIVSDSALSAIYHAANANDLEMPYTFVRVEAGFEYLGAHYSADAHMMIRKESPTIKITNLTEALLANAQTHQFSATIVGPVSDPNAVINWTVEAPDYSINEAGSIDSNGLYTPPVLTALDAPAYVNVRVTASWNRNANVTVTDTTYVLVQKTGPLLAFYINEQDVKLLSGSDSIIFTAAGSRLPTPSDVQYSVEGVWGETVIGSIDSHTGVYTPPATDEIGLADETRVQVKACLVHYPSVCDIAPVWIKKSGPLPSIELASAAADIVAGDSYSLQVTSSNLPANDIAYAFDLIDGDVSDQGSISAQSGVYSSVSQLTQPLVKVRVRAYVVGFDYIHASTVLNIDFNECASSLAPVCDLNATCTNLPGSYSCACNDGYTGDGHSCVANP